jgi:glycosyltransferase involved in cell wall biosynthesis
MSSISVLILTFNEEINLAACIESCSWSDDVVVFDSFSSDRTGEIASGKKARFIQRRFDNFAAQRNAALSEVRYKNSWVLMVDADERVPEELAVEMAAAVGCVDDDTVLFRMRRRDYFLGRWLQRSSGYPSWFGRLARIGRVRVERDVNEEYIADGKVAYLQAHLHHFPFNKGIAHWFEKHNRYSTMEAQTKIRTRGSPVSLKSFFSMDPIDRRRALKHALYRVPLRPSIVFLYLYVVRMGFLDGRAGLAFSRMRASYELLIDLKVAEADRRGRGAPD